MSPKKHVKKGARPPKPASPLRDVVADNFRAILMSRYGPQSQRKWAELSGISQGTVGRGLNSGAGITIDTVYDIGTKLGIEPSLLLTKGYFLQAVSSAA